MSSPNSSGLRLSQSYPSATNQWTVVGLNSSGSQLVVHARAVCAKQF
jgi:hypothetical protein